MEADCRSLTFATEDDYSEMTRISLMMTIEDNSNHCEQREQDLQQSDSLQLPFLFSPASTSSTSDRLPKTRLSVSTLSSTDLLRKVLLVKEMGRIRMKTLDVSWVQTSPLTNFKSLTS